MEIVRQIKRDGQANAGAHGKLVAFGSSYSKSVGTWETVRQSHDPDIRRHERPCNFFVLEVLIKQLSFFEELPTLVLLREKRRLTLSRPDNI